MSTALVTASTFIPPQIEGANFLNLMIIDDERAIREVCKEVAQSMGFNSCVADSAEHGYRMLETQRIDVVLLDLKLPGAGGLEAHIGPAVPVYANFAISGIDRVGQELRAAVNRRKREVVVARQSAEQMLRNELKGTLTALMLLCELSLQAIDPATVEGKIHQVYELALEMRAKLGIVEDGHVLKAAN